MTWNGLSVEFVKTILKLLADSLIPFIRYYGANPCNRIRHESSHFKVWETRSSSIERLNPGTYKRSMRMALVREEAVPAQMGACEQHEGRPADMMVVSRPIDLAIARLPSELRSQRMKFRPCCPKGRRR